MNDGLASTTWTTLHVLRSGDHMKITIDIPQEFEEHYKKDRFRDSLLRLKCDAHLLAGNYEQEVADMLVKAFENTPTAKKIRKGGVLSYYVCSECGGIVLDDYIYCSKCGAYFENEEPSNQIIHCKDCVYYYNTDPEQIPTSNIICKQMHEDDFCSYAKRMVNGA